MDMGSQNTGSGESLQRQQPRTKKWMHVAISYSFSPSDNDFKAGHDNPCIVSWSAVDGRNA